MDAATLALAFGCTWATADRYVAGMNEAMTAAGCTTPRRAAMWCAQVGHETMSLRYQEEIADGRAYNGRRDLGNLQPGDGPRFKGRGWIQLTGRNNYGAFSRWCHGRRLVPTDDHFVRNPTLVATSPWSGLAAAWYWTVARPTINARADAADVDAVTRLINGGTNGLTDRRKRWDNAIALGDRLLPTVDPQEDDLTPEQDRKLTELYMQVVQGDGKANDPRTWGWPGWPGGTGEHLTLIDMLRRGNVELRTLRNQVADLAKKITERT